MRRIYLDAVIAELKKSVEYSENNKKRILKFIEILKDKCLNKELTYYEYEILIHKKYDGKTLQEWLDYYNFLIKHAEKKIKREVGKVKIKKALLITSCLLLFSLFLFSLFFTKLSFTKEIFKKTVTGFVVQEEIRNLTKTNETLQEILEEINISTKQYIAVINQPVKWIKTIKLENITKENLTIEIPREAENISIKTGKEAREIIEEIKNLESGNIGITGAAIGSQTSQKTILSKIITFFSKFIKARITGRVIELTDSDEIISETDESKIIDLKPVIEETKSKELIIEYYTAGPFAIEQETPTGKIITVSSDKNYTDILSYTTIPELFSVNDKNKIRIYWREEEKFVDFKARDTNNNELIDYLEWNIPHLSQQTFEIILITKAEHLNETRGFIKDIYDYVKARDNNYSKINNNEYVRVTFEKNLTKDNDITIYARSADNNSAGVEVYKKDDNKLITKFENILEDKKYRVLLTNLTTSEKVFDLKIKGQIEFDYIVDPIIIASTNITNVSAIETWSSSDCTADIENVPHPSCITTNSSADSTIQASDDSWLYTAGAFGSNAAHLFKYQFINGSVSQIVNISWKWEGYGAGIMLDSNITLYIFNASNNNWSIFNSTTEKISDVIIEYFISSQQTINDIFNDTNYTHIITLQTVDGGLGGAINSDFITLTINYDNPPTINITNPTINNSSSTDSGLDINFTVSDDVALAECWYSNDTYLVNKSTGGCGINITNITWSNAMHNITIYVNDSLGNLNFSTITFNVSASVNSAPEIRYVDNATMNPNPANGLNAGPSRTDITINFSVFDSNGAGDLDNATARINFTRSGETARQNLTCLQILTNGNNANYSCTVTMWWYDGAGAWNINASISDLAGVSASNISSNFSVGETVGLNIGSLTFPGLAPGQTNQTSALGLLLNNTGNKAIPINAIQVNATNLRGETTNTLAIWARNMSVHWNSSVDSCHSSGGNGTKATNLSAGNFVNVSTANLTRGNFTINDNSTGQERLYFCMKIIGSDLTAQSYSTLNESTWTVQVLLAPLAYFGARKRKKNKKVKEELDKLEKKKEKSETKNKKSKATIENLSISITIFSKELGGLESLTKYLKENLGMGYSEIARILDRDQRTIWTAYKKAFEKNPKKLEVKETKIKIPLIIFKKELTVLESVIIYLTKRGFRFSEIAKLLDRDQRNVWTIYSNAVKKLGEKYKINKKESLEIITKAYTSVLVTIFSKELGGLESLTKYLKENLGMGYSEIARILDRDQRTIWTAYKKAFEKNPKKLEVKETKIKIPLIIFKKELTVLESVIIYLTKRGFRFSEIAKLLDRDQRNVWTIYSKAIAK